MAAYVPTSAIFPNSEVPLTAAGLGTSYDVSMTQPHVAGSAHVHFASPHASSMGTAMQSRPVIPPTLGAMVPPTNPPTLASMGPPASHFGYSPTMQTHPLGPPASHFGYSPTMPAMHASMPRNDLFTQRLVPPVTNKASAMAPRFLKWDGVRHFLAYVFTLCAFAVFAAPVVISISLASDHDVSFWIGRWGYLALFVPIFLFAQHFYHLWMLRDQNKLTRYLFILTPILPSVLFMIIGGTYMSYGRFLYGQLKSDDCSLQGALPVKLQLQDAYDVAHDAWERCIARKTAENMYLPLRVLPILQSCGEWQNLTQNDDEVSRAWKGHKFQKNSIRTVDSSNLPRWQYLANAEANHMCSGFCSRGPPLWTQEQKLGRDNAACALAVSFRFLSVVHYGLMVFAIGAIIFVITFPLYFASKGFLAGLGYSSSTTLA